MNPQDPLQQLRALHYPEAIGWWPLAPGWWALAAIVLVVLALALRIIIQRRRRSAYRRIAQSELRDSLQLWQQDEDAPGYLKRANIILKRVALISFPRTQCAALSGRHWTSFLDAQLEDDTLPLVGSALEDGPYSNNSACTDVPQLHRASLAWLAEHRSQPC